jgi:hypothetical protein
VAYATFPEGTLWRSKLDGSDNLQLSTAPFSPYCPDGPRTAEKLRIVAGSRANHSAFIRSRPPEANRSH